MEVGWPVMATWRTMDDAAKQLRISRRTLTRWVTEGRIRAYTIPGDRKRYVDLEEIKKMRVPQPVEVRRQAKPSVAACYIVRDGRLLMVKRRVRQGTLVWAGPSGDIEPGETPEQAAIREVREEVGIEIEVLERLGDRMQPATGRHLIYLACRVVAGEPTVVDHEEISDVDWAGWDTVQARWASLKGGIYPPVRAYLERVLVPATEQR